MKEPTLLKTCEGILAGDVGEFPLYLSQIPPRWVREAFKLHPTTTLPSPQPFDTLYPPNGYGVSAGA